MEETASPVMDRVSDIQHVMELYANLDQHLRSEVRQEIMRRACIEELGRGPAARRAGAAFPDSCPDAEAREFKNVPHRVADWFRDAGAAAAGYLPFDRYAPGDENRLDLHRREVVNAMAPVEWLMKSYFRFNVQGIENIPANGPAMIISNHGILPIGAWFFFYEILRATGRWPRALTDWRIYRVPYLRQSFMDLGMLVGTPANGDSLLRQGELLFIAPGGSKEGFKSSRYRYRLLWKGRLGFIRMALRNRCPIIPSANIGTDDTYRVFFNGYQTAANLFKTKKAIIPVSFPVGLGVLPYPVKMTQYLGEPIWLPYPPEAENDPEIVMECQQLVKSRVHELIDRGMSEREQMTFF